jgi:hypothetical protein
MIGFSKKYFKIFLTVLMLVLLLISIVIYILQREYNYEQKLNFSDSTYYSLHLISEEIAEILDTDVHELNIVNSNQIEINSNSDISYLSINFYIDKNKNEYQLNFRNGSYYVTYIGNYKSEGKNILSLKNLLDSIRYIEVAEAKTRIILNNEIVSSIKYKTNQEQYIVDNEGAYFINRDVEGFFMNIKRIYFLEGMWKVNDGVDFFLYINKN